jgi:hypothetical protein
MTLALLYLGLSQVKGVKTMSKSHVRILSITFIFVGLFLSQKVLAISPDGSRIPGMASIIDAQGDTWTIEGGIIKKGGNRVGANYNVTELHFIGGAFYQKNSSNEWYEWSGSNWEKISTPLVPSASGTTIGSTGHLIDNQTSPEPNVWSIQNGILYVNGLDADGNYNTTKATYENDLIYCENTSSEWYQWIYGSDKWQASNAPGPTSSTKVKYLSELGAKCDGNTANPSDDSAVVAKAIAGAAKNAYTLIVDCAANLDIGVSVDKSIFINNGTTVNFTSTGKFLVNNLFTPAFVIANSSNITLNNWNVVYTATWKSGVGYRTTNYGMPVTFNTGGYYLGGTWYAQAPNGTNQNGSGTFNDEVYSDYLSANKGIKFEGCTKNGGCHALWPGSICESAVFFLSGDTSNVTFNNISLTAASVIAANANKKTPDVTRFIPFGFMFATGYRSNQTLNSSTPSFTAANAHLYYATPTKIAFNGVTLDGYMMGFQGAISDSTFSNITAKNYSDLQDSNGNNVGGYNNTMPPPHLVYFDNMAGVVDSELVNQNLAFTTVKDGFDPSAQNPVSLRRGKARLTGGYSDAFKIQCVSCSIDSYTSYRKDGFMTLMGNTDLKVSNVLQHYDSGYTNNYGLAPVAWHVFRGTGPIANLTFSNVSLIDDVTTNTPSVATTVGPIDNVNGTNLLMDITVTLTKWGGGSSKPCAPTSIGTLVNGSNVTVNVKDNPSQSVTYK